MYSRLRQNWEGQDKTREGRKGKRSTSHRKGGQGRTCWVNLGLGRRGNEGQGRAELMSNAESHL